MLPTDMLFTIMDSVTVDLPDPLGTNPVAQRISIRPATQTSVDDFTDPVFYNYPTSAFFASVVRPGYLQFATVEFAELSVQFVPSFQVGGQNQSVNSY